MDIVSGAHTAGAVLVLGTVAVDTANVVELSDVMCCILWSGSIGRDYFSKSTKYDFFLWHFANSCQLSLNIKRFCSSLTD